MSKNAPRHNLADLKFQIRQVVSWFLLLKCFMIYKRAEGVAKISQQNPDIKIRSGANYHAKNLMWFRQKSVAQEIWDNLDKVYAHIKQSGAEKTGEIIIAIHTMDLDTKVFDAEVYVVIDEPISSTDKFEYRPEIKLDDCVAVKFIGGTHQLQAVYEEIHCLIKSLYIEATQPFYNVITDGSDDIFDTKWIAVDIYAATKHL
jgi:hypothetical protein